jgi:hypothetical protein
VGGFGAPGLGAAAGFGAPGLGPAAGLADAAGATGVSAGAGAGAGAAGAGLGAGAGAGAGVASVLRGAGAGAGAGAGVDSAGFWAAGFAAGLGALFAGDFSAAPLSDEPAAPPAGNLSRIRRTTGGSSVDDAERTYSPADFSSPSRVLLSTPSSFASS